MSSYTSTKDLRERPWVERITAFTTSSRQTMWESLGWVFELGIRPGMTLYQRKTLGLINRVTFFSLLMAFPGTFVLMMLGFDQPFSLMISGVLAACLVMGLNGAQQVDWSTKLFAFSPAAFIVIFTLAQLAPTGETNTVLLILSRQGLCLALLLPVLIYGFESQAKAIRMAGICVLIYLVYEVASMRLGALGEQDISGISHGLFSVLSVLQYLVLAGCVIYMQGYTFEQEKQAKQLSQKMQRLAIHDGLTGVYTRGFMEGMIGDAINRARRSKEPLALLMIDVDSFKQVNDTYGHNAGDDVLKELVGVLNASKRSTDYLGRWGGDELVMLLSDTNMAGATNLAEKLRRLVAEHSFAHCKQLTISVGAGEYQDGDAPLRLVGRADGEMYREKRGRGKREAFSI